MIVHSTHFCIRIEIEFIYFNQRRLARVMESEKNNFLINVCNDAVGLLSLNSFCCFRYFKHSESPTLGYSQNSIQNFLFKSLSQVIKFLYKMSLPSSYWHKMILSILQQVHERSFYQLSTIYAIKYRKKFKGSKLLIFGGGKTHRKISKFQVFWIFHIQ